MGSAFAYQLARAAHDVTVVARPGSKRFGQPRRDGGIVRNAGEMARVTVTDALDTARPYDIVIVTVLAHQVHAVLPEIQASRARQVHFMFVAPKYQRLAAAVAPKHATFGMAVVSRRRRLARSRGLDV